MKINVQSGFNKSEHREWVRAGTTWATPREKNGFSCFVVLLRVLLLLLLLLLEIKPRALIKHASTDLVPLCDFLETKRTQLSRQLPDSLMN